MPTDPNDKNTPKSLSNKQVKALLNSRKGKAWKNPLSQETPLWIYRASPLMLVQWFNLAYRLMDTISQERHLLEFYPNPELTKKDGVRNCRSISIDEENFGDKLANSKTKDINQLLQDYFLEKGVNPKVIKYIVNWMHQDGFANRARSNLLYSFMVKRATRLDASTAFVIKTNKDGSVSFTEHVAIQSFAFEDDAEKVFYAKQPKNPSPENPVHFLIASVTLESHIYFDGITKTAKLAHKELTLAGFDEKAEILFPKKTLQILRIKNHEDSQIVDMDISSVEPVEPSEFSIPQLFSRKKILPELFCNGTNFLLYKHLTKYDSDAIAAKIEPAYLKKITRLKLLEEDLLPKSQHELKKLKTQYEQILKQSFSKALTEIFDDQKTTAMEFLNSAVQETNAWSQEDRADAPLTSEQKAFLESVHSAQNSLKNSHNSELRQQKLQLIKEELRSMYQTIMDPLREKLTGYESRIQEIETKITTHEQEITRLKKHIENLLPKYQKLCKTRDKEVEQVTKDWIQKNIEDPLHADFLSDDFHPVSEKFLANTENFKKIFQEGVQIGYQELRFSAAETEAGLVIQEYVDIYKFQRRADQLFFSKDGQPITTLTFTHLVQPHPNQILQSTLLNISVTSHEVRDENHRLLSRELLLPALQPKFSFKELQANFIDSLKHILRVLGSCFQKKSQQELPVEQLSDQAEVEIQDSNILQEENPLPASGASTDTVPGDSVEKWLDQKKLRSRDSAHNPAGLLRETGDGKRHSLEDTIAGGVALSTFQPKPGTWIWRKKTRATSTPPPKIELTLPRPHNPYEENNNLEQQQLKALGLVSTTFRNH